MGRLSIFFIYLFVALLGLIESVRSEDDVPLIVIQGPDGKAFRVPENRKPTLYTDSFGDCNGNGWLTVKNFNAAYYKDNMTVMFNLEADTLINDDLILMQIGVYAYGESRFQLVFDPCKSNVGDLCPVYSNRTFKTMAHLPMTPQQMKSIPDIAETIPDFEGQAILRIFSKSTMEEVGCVSAAVTNGQSFSHPGPIGGVFGFFAAVAMVGSFLTQVMASPEHYAHTPSVMAIFAVFHHIYFTGALSVHWPGVLPAFWSNFAWSAGLINNSGVQNAIGKFVTNKGDLTKFGAMEVGNVSAMLGGGYDVSTIYRRDVEHLKKFMWYGQHVRDGLPLPGNFTGFPGTLAASNIAASDAFMISLVWYLLAIVLIVGSLVALKVVLECMERIKSLKDRQWLWHFRQNWIPCIGFAVYRTVLVGIFMLTTLALFQLAHFSGKATGVAITVFVIVFIGAIFIAFRPIVELVRERHLTIQSRRARFVVRKVFGRIPIPTLTLTTPTPVVEPTVIEPKVIEETDQEISDDATVVEPPPPPPPSPAPFSFPVLVLAQPEGADSLVLHDDSLFFDKHGWLYCRYRQSRWWFFSVWIVYELLRAIFIGAAASNPFVQVFGLLVIELIAFCWFCYLMPFQSRRLNGLIALFLGLSKVLTTGLSVALIPAFHLPRLIATGIGIFIIVIQGVLVTIVVAIVISSFLTTFCSLRYEVPDERFGPALLRRIRAAYFDRIERVAADGRPVTKDDPEAGTGSDPAKPKWDLRAILKSESRPRVSINDDVASTKGDEPVFRAGNAQRMSMIGMQEPVVRVPSPRLSPPPSSSPPSPQAVRRPGSVLGAYSNNPDESTVLESRFGEEATAAVPVPDHTAAGPNRNSFIAISDPTGSGAGTQQQRQHRRKRSRSNNKKTATEAKRTSVGSFKSFVSHVSEGDTIGLAMSSPPKAVANFPTINIGQAKQNRWSLMSRFGKQSPDAVVDGQKQSPSAEQGGKSPGKTSPAVSATTSPKPKPDSQS